MTVQSGDRIRVIGGPYQGWQGEILKVNDEQHATVLIPVFAKATAVVLPSSQIEPV
jgi:transcription antitermination factor NusG